MAYRIKKTSTRPSHVRTRMSEARSQRSGAGNDRQTSAMFTRVPSRITGMSIRPTVATVTAVNAAEHAVGGDRQAAERRGDGDRDASQDRLHGESKRPTLPGERIPDH